MIIVVIGAPGGEKPLDNAPCGLLLYRLLAAPHDAEVAQLVEQRPEKPRVRSSILRLGTISSLHQILRNPSRMTYCRTIPHSEFRILNFPNPCRTGRAAASPRPGTERDIRRRSTLRSSSSAGPRPSG